LDVPDPFRKCAEACMYLSSGNYVANTMFQDREKLYLFYDRGERFFGPVKNAWLSSRTKPGRPPDPSNWWDLFADIKDVDLPSHHPLQAADMIAWGHTRTLENLPRQFSYLKEWLIKVVPSSQIDFTEEVMRSQSKPRA